MNTVYPVIEKTNSEVARTAECISELDQRQKDLMAHTLRHQADMQQESKRAHEHMSETQIQGLKAQAQAHAHAQSLADMKELLLQFLQPSTAHIQPLLSRITGRSGI